MDGLFEFAEALGIEHGPPRWDIPIEPADREAAAALAEPGRPVLVISPCTGQRFRNYRNWRVERYARIADLRPRSLRRAGLADGGGTRIEAEYGRASSASARSRPKNLIGPRP